LKDAFRERVEQSGIAADITYPQNCDAKVLSVVRAL
jgi:hypothetical protein